MIIGFAIPSVQADTDEKGREFFDLNNSEIAEDQAIGTLVGTFTNLGSVTPTYSLADDAEDTDNHLFTINGTELRTAAVFDFETRDAYTVLVIARVDGEGGLGKIFTINITDINEEPVITEGDAVSVEMDEDGTPAEFSLTLNANDPDGDTLTWSISGPAGNGTASVSGTGDSKAITYSPAPGYNGSDSFVVQVEDGNGGSDTITVNVTIRARNDLPVIDEGNSTSVQMDEDGSPTPFDLTLHASDPDGDTLTWSISSDAENGTASVSGKGNAKAISYSPASGYNGSDSFGVQVNDGNGGTDTITVNVAIQPQNDAPGIDEGDTISVQMDEDGSPTPFELTLHAGDPDGDTLTWSIISDAKNGTAGVSGTGDSKDITYAPNAGFSGDDIFAVQVSDGELTDAIIVIVTISGQSDAPVIEEGDSISVRMDEDGSPLPFGLTLHASDADGDTLTWSVTGDAENGTASVSGTGDSKDISYTPNSGFSGQDSFEIQVSDGELTDTIIVEVIINGQNDAPVIDESDEVVMVYMDEDGDPRPFSLTLQASDPDGDVLTWSILTSASNGIASASGTGEVVDIHYTPDAGYNGADSFEVQVSDGQLTDTITVEVSISPKTAGNCDAVCDAAGGNCVRVHMDEDGFPKPFDLNLTASDPDNDVLTWSISIPAEFGDADANGTGYSKDISYFPDTDYNGVDSFEVQVSDGQLTDELVVCVNITPQNDPPAFKGIGPITAIQDVLYAYPIVITDPDADDTYLITPLTIPDWLSLVNDQDGATWLSGTPTYDDLGRHEIQLQVEDSYGETDTQIFTITVKNFNDAPVVSDLGKTGNSSDVAFDTDDFTSRFSDQNTGNTLEKIRITAVPENGVLELDGEEVVLNQEISVQELESLAYLPDAEYEGEDSFEWSGSNGTSYAPDSAKVMLTIVKPQIRITQKDSLDPVQSGDTLTYTIDYVNEGSGPATQVVITGNWDGRLRFVSADPAPDAGTVNQWTLPDLASGDSGSIVVEMAVSDSLSDDASALSNEVTAAFEQGTTSAKESTGVLLPLAGDIDDNGIVELDDALLGLQIVSGMSPDQSVSLSADANDDGRIGMEDIVHIFRMISE